jgi:hypothetical protein
MVLLIHFTAIKGSYIHFTARINVLLQTYGESTGRKLMDYRKIKLMMSWYSAV